MQVVILAGGRGTRLLPLTQDVPKPMVPIRGRPFLEYQLRMLKKQGFKDVVLCVGYLADKISRYFGEGASLGLRIAYSVEQEPLGTGGALRFAYDTLADDFLLLNGDTYLDVPYAPVCEFYKKEDVSGVIVVYNNMLKLAANNVLIKTRNRISCYGEGEGLNYVDAGVYVFKKEALRDITPGRQMSLHEAVLTPLIKKGQLAGYTTDKRYYDIGTFDRITVFENEVVV